MQLLFRIVFFSLLSFGNAAASNIILEERVGTSLHPIQFFKDSTYTYPTGHTFMAGHVFKIIGETAIAYEDDSQNQKYKWYHAETPEGHRGWLFGDGIAIIKNEEVLSTQLKKYHKQLFSFDNGFEKATLWIAEISGRDNFHKQDFLNPAYTETYLVISNEKNRAVSINIGGTNARGSYGLKQLDIEDITGDQIAELIVQTQSNTIGETLTNNNLMIYSFQAGSLKKVFEEKLDLQLSDQERSPAIRKQVEIGDQTIRIAYPDFVDCNKSHLEIKARPIDLQNEKCLEYVTYTYQWENFSNQYQLLYEPSHTAIQAQIRQAGITLLEKPTIIAKRIAVIPHEHSISLLKHYKKRVRTGRREHLVVYFLIELPSGEQGYVLSDQMEFRQIEHADLLQQYYRNPNSTKLSFSSDRNFVKITKDADAGISRK